MKSEYKFHLAPVAMAVAGAFALYGCGGDSEVVPAVTATPTATVVAPVVNSPLKDVTVTLNCADGSVGGSGIAADGSVSIAVPITCAAPFTMAVSGKGTMAGPDLKFGTDDDETYDAATRTALKSVVSAADLGLAAGAALTSGASVNAPTIDSLTTMVAEKLAKANPSSTEIDAAKAAVAGVTGVAVADLYKNPMTNGEVFKAATLINEMVASAMKADPSKNPSDLVKSMAASTTAKLTDATVDPAALMGMSTANAAIMQAQMATIQAKASAMKSVADAVAANVASASQAGLMPADALKALNAALAGTQANDIATVMAKAKMAQDAMNQMATQMDALRKDTTVAPADLQAKMTALVQGLEAVRFDQDAGIQASIVAAAGDPTKIADALKQASSMIMGAAPAMLTSVVGASLADLQSSGFMTAAAASITSQFDPAKMAAAMAAAGGDPSKVDFASMGLDPAKIVADATAQAAAAAGVNLTLPSALTSNPVIAAQVVGMVINRATNNNWLASTQLQAWVNAIGTALAKNDAALLTADAVGSTIAGYFHGNQTEADLRKAPPSTLTLTIGAATSFTQSTTPISVTPPTGTTTPPTGTTTPPTDGTTSSLPLCPELMLLTPPVQPQIGVNCRAPT